MDGSTSALIAWHGFWLVLLAPPVGLMIWRLAAPQLRSAGIALTAVVLLIVAIVGLWQAATWLPHVRPGQPSCFGQRFAFTIVTMVDLPVIAMGLSGLALLAGARFKRSRNLPAEVSPALPRTASADGATGNARPPW